MKKNTTSFNPESGQVLLVVVMILAVVLTIVLTITLKSLTSSRTTNIQQEATKSLAAAESAVDQALRTNTTVDLNTLANFPQIAGSAQFDTTTSGDTFITDLIERDSQYTFYFSDFNPTANTFGAPWGGGVIIYFGSENPTATCGDANRPPALELVFVKTDNTIQRKLVEPCSVSPRISYNAGDSNVIEPNEVLPVNTGTLLTSNLVGNESVQFGLQTPSGIPNVVMVTDTKVMVVRVLFNATKLGIKADNVPTLPSQGRIVNSEAQSASGVTKKVKVFQSYPQLPSEFFVTSL